MEFKIKEAAKNLKGWSVYELAKHLGLPRNTVYNWSWGKTRPSYENLVKICQVLGCTPNDLLELQ